MSTSIVRAAALAAVVLPAIWAGAAPLSLDQATDLAVQRSQLTASARASTVSAAETARAAGLQPDPLLSVGIDNLPATGSRRFSGEDMTMKRIGIAQQWLAADKRAARRAAAQAVVGREAVMEQIGAAQTRLQTALAYVTAYHAGQALSLTMLGEAHAREELEAGKGRLATLAGNSAEVLGLSSALGAAEDGSADLRQQQAAAQAMLQRWTGRAADELEVPRLPLVPPLDAFVANHPAVLARQPDIEVARQELRVARLDRRPDWTFEVSYGQRQGRPDLVSFGASVPLAVAPAERQDREAAARQALVDKAEAELEEVRRAAAGEYASLSSDARRLQERIERFQAGAVTALTQRTAATLAAYRANQASLPMLFEARRAEVEAQRRLLGLQRELALTQAQLVYKPISRGALP